MEGTQGMVGQGIHGQLRQGAVEAHDVSVHVWK